jgi:hypothetical protein
MSGKDLESFDRCLDESDVDSDSDDEGPCYDFEVKKSQEIQDVQDFTIHPGFKV